MSGEDGKGLFEILPRLGCNSLQHVLEEGVGGILGRIFPNAGAMFGWFRGLSENSLKGFAILNTISPKSPFQGGGKIHSPIGLPKLGL